jgi:hypothetical protein
MQMLVWIYHKIMIRIQEEKKSFVTQNLSNFLNNIQEPDPLKFSS